MNAVNLFLGLSLVVIAAAIFYLNRIFSYWSRKKIPNAPPKSWIFGNTKDIIFGKQNSAYMYDEVYRKFENEPLCGFYEFHCPILLVRDPKLIHKVMVENFNSFHDTKFSEAMNPNQKQFFELNPFILKGSSWKETRSVLTSLITPSKLRVLDDVIKPILKNVTAFLDNNPNDIEAYELAAMFTSEMVAHYGWGISSDGFSKDSTVKKIFDMNPFLDSKAVIIQHFFPTLAKLLKLKIHSKEFIDMFENITEQAISHFENNTSSQGTFLQNLLSVREKLRQNGKDMTTRELNGHISTFYLDAYETVARVLSLFIQHLMMYPDVQQRLREEINELTGEITIDAVNKLQYMEMVLSEVARVYPVVSHYSRVCTERCKLGTLDVDVGTYIVIPVYSIHYDPKYYPNPETFNPENFTEENKSQRPKLTHFIFGHGPRMCPGMKYATANLKLFISYLLKEYEILPPTDHPANSMKADPRSAVFLIPEGKLYVRIKKLQ